MTKAATLYHYCSANTFHAIVESRSIRLSSLSLSNDTMEGKLVASTIHRLAKRDAMDASTIERLLEMLQFFDDIFDGLGFCLSEERDLLSQWRGYADDGYGVAIGFSKEYLDALSSESTSSDQTGFSLKRVEYELTQHEIEVDPTFREAKRLIDNGAFSYSGFRGLLDGRSDDEIQADKQRIEKTWKTLSMTLLMLFPKLYLLKSPAFREEKEWRLVSHLVHSAEDDHCEYRGTRDRIVPFRSVRLPELPLAPITEVLLGPKHATPVRVVEHFLRRFGFLNVRVHRSEASYR